MEFTETKSDKKRNIIMKTKMQCEAAG